jgi:hypothetical protein
MTYEEGVKVLEDPDIDRFMQAWHDRITGNDRWLVRIGLKPVMVLDFREKMKAFADYLEEHSRSPHYSYTPGDFRQMDCPNVQIVRVTLMRDLHLSDSEVMDRPWVMCLWDYITLKALAGQVAICNKDEISEAQEVANRLQAIFDSRKVAINGAS